MAKKKTPNIVNIIDAKGHDRFDDVYREHIPTVLKSLEIVNNLYVLKNIAGISLQVRFVTEDVIHFAYTHISRNVSKHSYFVVEKYWDNTIVTSYEKVDNLLIISSKKLICTVILDNLNIKIEDKNGTILQEDRAGFYAKSTFNNGTEVVKTIKKIRKNESFWGLGDKTESLNLKGNTFTNWCTDAFAFGEGSDPMYRSVPFYYTLHNSIGSGLFLDNTYQSDFDFGSKKKSELEISVRGGNLDYYFIYGPDLIAVTQKYHELTGKPELPPLWALGYHQSRWSYFPDTKVMEIAESFRSHKIPCDAIYLDIDYMDKYLCFTWNHNYFPEPKGLTDQLKALGFHTVVMIDPGIGQADDYPILEEGKENGYFIKRNDGELLVGYVWPGDAYYPDFTNPKVRTWFGELYKELYMQNGISGFWNDMNEPALFKVHHKTITDNVLHDCEGNPSNHKRAHNVYGQLMSMSTYEGLKKLNPKKRPFLLSRASTIGGQRYAAVWTGDNVASWGHLALANKQMQRLNISGYCFSGSDIGGFVDRPSGELMVRWLQLGIFHPFYRVHSMGNHADGSDIVDEEELTKVKENVDQEPWSFDEPFTTHARKAIELRYQLLPYLYTAFREHTTDGTPILKSMIFMHQDEITKYWNHFTSFYFGNHMIVSPVLESKLQLMTVDLPKGDWYYFKEGTFLRGEMNIPLVINMDSVPIFVKAGAVIPMNPIIQNTAQSFDNAILRIYLGDENYSSEWYEDEGENYSYVDENYRQSTFEMKKNEIGFTIKRKIKGNFIPKYIKIEIEIFFQKDIFKEVIVDSKVMEFKIIKNSTKILVERNFEEIIIN
jgi:alpha-glucosidase